jgi:hypothetical protein
LEALGKALPKSMIEVADTYGTLFSTIQQSWLKALEVAAAEAAPGGTIIPDEDPKQIEINSPVSRQLRRHLYGDNTPTALSEKQSLEMLNRTVNDSLAARRGAIHELHTHSPGSPARAMALKEESNPGPFHVFQRGNPLARGAVVAPGFLSVLNGPHSEPFPEGKRRLGLARAVVSPDNPLTRRVLVNWVWQHHFGVGLVRTPDDWGVRGHVPTHPGLLDYLAALFLEEGDSIKKLHRRIMLSSVYAQQAREDERSRTVDPDNELLWRMPSRRLEMEAMLDSMLATSDELDLTAGGRPFDRQVQTNVLRRSVYAFVNRDVVSALSSTFDAANPSACTARRPDTTVPQQALFALNSEFIQDRAQALAALTARSSGGDDSQRVQELYRRVFSRNPDRVELDRVLRYVKSAPETLSSSAWQQVAHALLAANEFSFVD